MNSLHYSKSRIEKAGQTIIDKTIPDDKKIEEYKILNYWKNCHKEPLELMAGHIENNILNQLDGFLVSRLKRNETIIGKLARGTEKHLNLRQIYDIAGCRIVFNNIKDVYRAKTILNGLNNTIKINDYIENPKTDGYRSIHLIHSFDTKEYDNLKVETQLRTQLQHAWATSVETFDLINHSKLKFGLGSTNETKYFKLLSDLISIEEKTNRVQSAEKMKSNIVEEFRALDNKLQILEKLKGFCNSVRIMDKKNLITSDFSYFLIYFDKDNESIKIWLYPKYNASKAFKDYANMEMSKTKTQDYLLVTASNLETITKAYPNYFSNLESSLLAINKLIN